MRFLTRTVFGMALFTGALLTCPSAQAAGVTVGSFIPRLYIEDLKGGDRLILDKLVQQKDLTVFIFLSARCLDVERRSERIAAIAKQYQGATVQFVGIYVTPEVGRAERLSNNQRLALPFPSFADVDGMVSRVFGLHVTPEVMIADRRGRVVFHGGVDDAILAQDVTHRYLADALAALTAKKPPPKPYAPVAGCWVKH